MAYGTTYGVSDNIPNYTQLISDGAFDADMVDRFRVDADGIIDAKLSQIVDKTNLPLASPPTVIDTISDMMTACMVMRARVFLDEDPNESPWLTRICEAANDLLDSVIDSPELFEDANGNDIAENQLLSTTEDQDRIFTATRTSGDGATTVETGTMEDW